MILMTEEIRNTLTEEVKKLIAAPLPARKQKPLVKSGSQQPARLTKKLPRLP